MTIAGSITAIALVAAPVIATAASLTLSAELSRDYAIEAGAAPGQPGRVYFLDADDGELRFRDPGDPAGTSRLFYALPRSGAGGDFDPPGETGSNIARSFAFASDYETSGRFFVSYVDEEDDLNVIEGARATADRAIAGGTVIASAEYDTATRTHWAGDLTTGPDGALYLSTGDADRDAGANLAQDINSREGKILRIDIGGENVGPADVTTVATGLRNPFQTFWDDTEYYVADVGEDRFEEVNRVPLAALTGDNPVNFGWPGREGFADFRLGTLPDGTGITELEDPIFAYGDASVRTSISGGAVYRGGLPGLGGEYVFGDFVTGRIFSFDPGSPASSLTEWQIDMRGGPQPMQILGIDVAGDALFVSDLSGGFYRATATTVPLPAPAALLALALAFLGLARTFRP